MASNGHPVHLFSPTEAALYFKVGTETDVEVDNFRRSTQPAKQSLMSNNGKYLTLNGEKFEGKELTPEQKGCSEYKLTIERYQDTNLSRDTPGRAVFLYFIKAQKKMVVCCNDKHEVQSMEMVSPVNILGKTDKAIFYMTELITSECMFESSWFPSEFLAFDYEDHHVAKLVLRCRPTDVPDEPSTFCSSSLQ